MTTRSRKSMMIGSLSSNPLAKYSLLEEIQQGRVSKGLELLEKGLVDANEIDKVYGWSALHVAARDGKVALARSLIEHGANVNLHDAIQQTPLHRAAYWNQKEMVELLLQNGADFTAYDSLFQTPDELARNHGHVELATYLEQQIAFLVFDTLNTRYSKQDIARMMDQLRKKSDEEERRRVLKAELEYSRQEAERELAKSRSLERKIMERRTKLAEKAEKYKDEIKVLANQTGTGLTKKQLARFKTLQGKLKKLQTELEDQKAKINKARRRSVENMIVELKGDALVDYINS